MGVRYTGGGTGGGAEGGAGPVFEEAGAIGPGL
jgi:hypothetical protein